MANLIFGANTLTDQITLLYSVLECVKQMAIHFSPPSHKPFNPQGETCKPSHGASQSKHVDKNKSMITLACRSQSSIQLPPSFAGYYSVRKGVTFSSDRSDVIFSDYQTECANLSRTSLIYAPIQCFHIFVSKYHSFSAR